MNIYLFLSITFFIISVLTANYKTKHLYNALLNAFFIFLYLTITIMYFSADYFTGKGITQAVLFTLETGLQGAGFGEYLLLISISTFLFIAVFALSYLYLRFIKHREHPKPKRIKGIMHNTFLLFAFLTHPFDLDLYSIYTSMHMKQSTDFDQYYNKAQNLSTTQIQDYNLVYIYAESLERTYFDETIFPGLMNNLKELKKTSTDFTDINQVTATGWTIGGMTATQCGIPLFTTSGGNSMSGSDSFLSGTTCMGDILKSQGYHLAFMQGSSVNFSGIRQLYTTHKFDEIYGVGKLKQQLKDKNYHNGWGLYDDTLLPIVYEKFEALSQTDKPFSLFMATIDTHHPNGMTSKSCSDIPYGRGNNRILNAVHCSDRLISNFIKKIQNSKYGDKTLIVLTSDHLAMRNTATNLLNKNKRRDLFLIFDPREKQYVPIDKAGSMLDVGSTVLSKLGLKTDIGLGRNLLQEKSLFTKFDKFNKKLLSWRDSILKLWEFPILGKSYDINTTSMKIFVGEHSYSIPMLAKIGDNNTITPFFIYHADKELYEYLTESEPKQKFIWIDSCDKINALFDLKFTEKQCIFQGSLSDKKIDAKPLHDKMIRMNTTQLLSNTVYNSDLFYKRLSNILEKTLIFKHPPHPPEGKITIVSSRHPIHSVIPSVILTSKKKFSLSRGLNILTINDKGEYVVQRFDVYGSQDDAKKFLETIKYINAKKQFWAMLIHGAVKNTWPGYKETLTTIGFKVLPTLNNRVAYIAYKDEKGKIHEYSDKDTLRKIIPSFIK